MSSFPNRNDAVSCNKLGPGPKKQVEDEEEELLIIFIDIKTKC